MSVAPPPEAPAVPRPAPAASAPVPPAYRITPSDDEGPRTERHRGVLGGLILIALGIAALGGTWFPGGGAWLFLGLGTAFLIGRVLTGRHGYAVPAGTLLAFGSFVWFTETGILNSPQTGAAFFVFLGLGFLAAYAIAARPGAVWPVLPGVMLIGFGAFIQATMFGAPFEQFWWLAHYWPPSLVAVGAWLVLHDRLPAAARAPVAIIGVSALILIGLLVAAAGMAMVVAPYARTPITMPMPWPMFQGVPGFGNPPLEDTVTLSAPVGSADLVSLVNTRGNTVVQGAGGLEVRVQATRHYWVANQPPEVRLMPGTGALAVEVAPASSGSYIDNVVDSPSALGADVRSASGSVSVSGLMGPVRVETGSGSIDLRDLQGSAMVTTASGGVRLTNLAGDLGVSSVSGGISGTGLPRLSDARSTSGGIDLTGDFATDAQIVTVSGGVTLRLTPVASLRIDELSLSGDVSASDLALDARQTGSHRLSGNLGAGTNTLAVRSTSGSIRLVRSS
jgi:Putative adhesin